jgi:hypothetical protein
VNFIYELVAFVLADGVGANLERTGLFGREAHAVLMLAAGLACAASIGIRSRRVKQDSRIASGFFFGLAAAVYTFALSVFPQGALEALGMLLLYGGAGGALSAGVSEGTAFVLNRKEGERVVSPGEKEVIEKFVIKLAEQEGLPIEVNRWPAEENRRLVDIDAVAGPFAIEHASVDDLRDDKRLAKRLRKRLSGKARKLSPYRNYGKSTILLVELNEASHVSKGMLVEALRKAFKGRLPDGVGRLWLADTGGASEFLFHEITGDIKGA